MEQFISKFWHKQLGRPYRLHVQQHSQNGPTIIFLHGIAASSDKWSNLIPLLQGSYRCITLDLLGFGKSPKPQWSEYRMEDHLRSLHKTIAGLGLKQDFILAGHSLGGLLATRYTHDYPQHVNQLLLLSPPVYPPLADIDGRLARGRTALFLKLYKFLRSHPRITPTNFKRLSLILPLPKSIITHPATWTPFMRTLEHCIEQQTIRQDIINIEVPIDIFYGVLDQVIVIKNIEALAKFNDVQIHSIKAANHDINRFYAASVATQLLPGPLIKPAKRKTRAKGSGISRKPHTS